MYGQINKLFIIGNGFDLAHGLKTQYKDFIDTFWEDEKSKIITTGQSNFFPMKNDQSYEYKDDILTIKTPRKFSELHKSFFSQNATGYEWFASILSNSAKSKMTYTGTRQSKVEILVKNHFLHYISKKSYLQNWVDIESEYYHLLKECYRIQSENSKTTYTVFQLNNDFLEVSNLLEKYLSNLMANTRISTNPQILDKFKSILQPELSDKKHKNNEKDNIVFLNFNYTNTDIEYIVSLQSQISQQIQSIHIHGELFTVDNPIIFGYGDELDEDYIKLENSNIDDYLINIKSIKYLETPNYINLLRFLESYKYDVYIMGHSCGISDRTLLNTIFENDNCSKIKIFYHQRDDRTDDHNEKIMNITRNFKHKPSMRAKVIDKTNCEPLI